MGALSDRYRIATEGAVDVQLAAQVLLNFDPTVTGGDCSGGRSNPYWIGIGVRSGPSCDFQLKWSLCYFAVLVLRIECRSDCTFT